MIRLSGIKFSIDRGGTFTDVYAEVPGEPGFRVVKLLSENPDHYPDAPLEGIRRVLADVGGENISSGGIDGGCIEWIRMGTTLATNALLERRGAKMALLITRGFGDLLTIGKQNRPRIFDLEIRKPPPLCQRVVEVDERVRLCPRAAGSLTGLSGEAVEVLLAPDLERLQEELAQLKAEGIESLAVAFLHAYTFPAHELLVGALAEELGFSQVSLSSQVLPKIRLVDRGQTTAVDAALTPLIKDYLQSFRAGFKGKAPELFFMQSDGGLTRAATFSGCRAVLSGPAGGVVGAARTTALRFPGRPVIGFDMGGTSTDVSRFDGEYEWTEESETAGVHLQVPQLDIRTVAAGGGSRLFFENGLFVVGPESSGAHPGPVCYKNGGPLSLTDANLFLGRLLPEFFPRVFGPQEDEPLDAEATRRAFLDLAGRISAERGEGHALAPEAVALGFIEVANETMVRPIREISVTRGFDVKQHVLACFGGAGGQHACALARALGMAKVFVHRHAGILSAYGLGLADVVVDRREPAAVRLEPANLPELLARLDELVLRACRELERQGNFHPRVRRYLNLRVEGADAQLMIAEPADGDFFKEFLSTHEREFGFKVSGRGILVDELWVRVTGKCPPVAPRPLPGKERPTTPAASTRCYFKAGWADTPVYRMRDLGAGEVFEGPALLIDDTSTILIEPGCTAGITPFGDVEMDIPPPEEPLSIPVEADPVELALFGNRFMSIAEQMGRQLVRTAISTNIKERQDFSCALFGPEGDLVANAPHQPVHLGAMGEAVQRQLEIYRDDMRRGDVWVTNDPAFGGSHLPDITVITPVIDGGRPVFFIANRGHHADIGGITPGSMPAFSETLAEEGAVIRTFKLVEGGVFREKEIAELLAAPGVGRDGRRVPGTRALADNLADLKAQVAANQKGVELVRELIRHSSLATVQAYMGHLQDNADASVRHRLQAFARERGLKAGAALEAEDHLDDGSPLCLRLWIDPESGRAVFDFAGTAAQLAGNLNAPRAVTSSVILYCLRCLVQGDLPLNQGCLRSIDIRLPGGSLLAPGPQAAVAGGNTLTSQRITDVVLKAFGAAAASQGCMNNLTFGNARFGYYETIGGGAGAGPGWQGQSAVHTHMTNTRITDPEILEKRYPLLLREFSIRRGSGGMGAYKGGDGLVRDIEFLEPLEVTVLSERRVFAPYGLAGGGPGAKGRNLWIAKDGGETDLGGKNQFTVQPGDRVRILTPGGGGYGKAGG
jgi:5-oxoprolinase (ATP-hydrolysing)